MNVHHIALSVRNLKESQAFYERLGFREIHSWEAANKSLVLINLKLGDIFLELMAYAQNAMIAPLNLTESSKAELGLKHFALQVPSIQNAYTQMKQEGYKIRDAEIKKGRTGIDYFFVIDPDGMWVEIVQDDRGY